MKSLVLAEKPSVGKEIARVLNCHNMKQGYAEGNQYIVTWAYGHLVTLADPDAYDKKYIHWHLEDLPILPDHLKKVVIKKTGKQYNTVKQLMHRGDVKEIIIATDAGREGELVARWIMDKAKIKKPAKRLWISSITDKAIKDGFKHLKPGKDFLPLYHAAIARAEGDWLVGINATRALTTKYNTQLSCGRVQTPTLAMVKMREEAIRSFRPKYFYGLVATQQGRQFVWHDRQNNKHVFDEGLIDGLQKKLGLEGHVSDVQQKEKRQLPGLLYDLTELQRDAYNRFGYSPKETLNIMQRLYEQHKVLTYPRTDARYLTDDILPTIGDRLKAITIQPYRKEAFSLLRQPIKGGKHFINNAKVSDHHAIIPTEEAAIISSFTHEERNIYELVVKRFLEVLMPPYKFLETRVTVLLQGESFVYKGEETLELGWKVLSEIQKKMDRFSVKKGDRILFNQLTKTQGETSPPSRFNEATLLSAMENPGKYMDGDEALKKILQNTGGLGTVATRADIIEKLFNTQVIEKKGKEIYITKKGRQLLEVVPDKLKSPKLTAEWELELKKIAENKASHHKFISDMTTYTEMIISEIKGSEQVFKHDNVTTTPCPECGKMMLRQATKNGTSLQCPDRNCNKRIRISQVTNARCPECHKKLELKGSGDQKIFACKCGYREKLSAFEKRKNSVGKKGGKKDYQNYMKQQEKEAEKQKQASNPFAALKNLEL